MKKEVLDYFLENNFKEIPNLIELLHENVLVLERDGKESYVLICNENSPEMDFKGLLRTIMSNDKNKHLYIVTNNELHLYLFVKAHIFRWVVQEYCSIPGVVTDITIHFQTLKKLKEKGLKWETRSF
ncbi:hypothetical protein bcgnr5369_03290 [Bacillus cereus]|uniref:Uncharacterized protein n=1 Tax=Bacillus thuringiensis TaxID=1428 RepID=A0A9X6WRJ7_BACTU|nr:hypothetical protein [Bacillus thuringiensis]PFJ42767.1 hypothetical protein COJ15_05345 [Bacillus thuringiensis]